MRRKKPLSLLRDVAFVVRKYKRSLFGFSDYAQRPKRLIIDDMSWKVIESLYDYITVKDGAISCSIGGRLVTLPHEHDGAFINIKKTPEGRWRACCPGQERESWVTGVNKGMYLSDFLTQLAIFVRSK